MGATLGSITIRGLKGEAPATYDLGPLTFVTGRNGQGKSRIREALDFALGRDVGGVSAAGKELRAALEGAELDVSLHVRVLDGIDHYSNHLIRRVRRVEKGTFKRPQVFLDGVESTDDALAALLGDLSAPAGQSWLDMSEDKLLAELARLGARARAGKSSVVDAVRQVAAYSRGALAARLCAEIGAKCPPMPEIPPEATPEVAQAAFDARAGDVVAAVDGCDLSRLLAAVREVAKGEVNDAQKAFKAIEGSADRSREMSTAAEVRPDKVSGMDAKVKAADAECRTAQEASTRARAAVEQGAKPLADWKAARARLEARVEDARRRLGGLPVPDETTKAAVDDEPLRAALNAAGEYESQVAAERDAAAKAERDAMFTWGQAENTTKGAAAALRVLDAGHCPTCRQAITGDVRAIFDRALTDAKAAEASAKAALDESRVYLQQQRDELNFAASERGEAQRALDEARALSAAAGRNAAALEAYNGAKTAMENAQAELRAFLEQPAPAEPADAIAQANSASAEAERLYNALQVLRREHHDLLAKVEKYKRWRGDLKARTDAEARKKAADVLMETVRTAERSLAKAGADELLAVASMYLPPSFGEPLVFEGAVGIRKGAAFWSGPGLSSAQRLVLALAIDRALDQIQGRKLRLALIEAEALDDDTLDHVCAALEGDVDMGLLDAALLLSCHEPTRLTDQWRRIHVGPQSPARGPGGGEHPDGGAPPPVFSVGKVTDEQAAEFRALLAEHNKNPGPVFILPAVEMDVVRSPAAVPNDPGDSATLYHMPEDDEPGAYDEPGVWVCPDCQKDTGGLTHYCPATSEATPVPQAQPSPLTPEGAAVLASIVEADVQVAVSPEAVDEVLAEPAPQAEMALGGVAPKDPPPAPTSQSMPDATALSDVDAAASLVALGLSAQGLTPAQARDILARRMAPDAPAFVAEKTAAEVRARLPKVPPPGVADWLWRPGLSRLTDEERDALVAKLSARTMNELTMWPGGASGPYEAHGLSDEIAAELDEHGLLTKDRLTGKGEKLWRFLHPEFPEHAPPPKTEAQVARETSTALAIMDGAGVTPDEARAAIKGMGADALKALGAECANVPVKANMTIGKRRDEIAARLHLAGVLPSALADMVAKFVAAYPPKVKTVDKPDTTGDGAQDETNEVGAAVVPEGEHMDINDLIPGGIDR